MRVFLRFSEYQFDILVRNGHFENLSTAYSHEWFESLCSQSSTGSRTEATDHAYWREFVEWNNNKWMFISWTKSFSGMRLSFSFMSSQIIKTVAFEDHSSPRLIGARYCDIITQIFMIKSQYMDEIVLWLQQDDTTWHTVRETIRLLNQPFPGWVVFCFGDHI